MFCKLSFSSPFQNHEDLRIHYQAFWHIEAWLNIHFHMRTIPVLHLHSEENSKCILCRRCCRFFGCNCIYAGHISDLYCDHRHNSLHTLLLLHYKCRDFRHLNFQRKILLFLQRSQSWFILIYIKITMINYMPAFRHDWVLQSWVSQVEPVQAFPPFDWWTRTFR